jgi:hypothetical protein
MQTGEPQGGAAREERRDQRDLQRIGIGGGDDQIARIQLAARWSESFAPEHGDSLAGMLKRFRTAYDYLDSVTHGLEPAGIEPDRVDSSAPTAVTAPAPPLAPEPGPPPAPEPQPQSPKPEPRPW